MIGSERGRDVFGSTGISHAGPTLGVMLPVFGAPDGTIDPALVGDVARYAEAQELDGVWVGDHLVHPLPLLESIVSLEHAASVTERIRVGTAVLLVALRRVLPLARQLATLALYHPGRLSVGVGIGGEHPGEFHAAGVPVRERGARVAEAVRHMRDLWAGRVVASAGSFADLTEVRLAPMPPPIPLFFGGHTPTALRRAARLGDAWVGFYKGVDEFAQAREVVLREREAAGLSAEPFALGMVLPTVISERGDAMARAAGLMRGASTKDFQSSPDRFVLAGAADQVLGRIAEYHKAGCDHFILAIRDQGKAYWDQMVAVSEQILPGIRSMDARG